MRTAKLTKVVDQDIHARFDVVVSINAIHTMEEPSEAISALGETLAADGRAFIVDPTEFAPSAMVTAAIAQCAFGDGEPSGLLSPEKWSTLFRRKVACRLGKNRRWPVHLSVQPNFSTYRPHTSPLYSRKRSSRIYGSRASWNPTFSAAIQKRKSG